VGHARMAIEGFAGAEWATSFPKTVATTKSSEKIQ
jgi:hypothetical protein